MSTLKKRSGKGIYQDKNGRTYQKQSYFVGGRMKFHRVYLIDGIPVDEFCEKNDTVMDLVIYENYHLIDAKQELVNSYLESNPSEEKGDEDLPF